MKKFLIFSLLILSGCAKINPFSPELKQEVNNQHGKIDEIKNNQNGMMLELMKLRNENQIQAEKIDNFQQGFANFKKTNENSGIQILQGDGALVLVFGLGTIGLMLIYHYRTEALKHKKTAEIFAKQISLVNDPNLENNVFMAAMNSDVEGHVYKLMIHNQTNQRGLR